MTRVQLVTTHQVTEFVLYLLLLHIKLALYVLSRTNERTLLSNEKNGR